MKYWEIKKIGDIEGEKWLPMLGYEAEYMVSNLGRIKKLGNKPMIMSQSKQKGYVNVSICVGNKKMRFRSHRLVGFKFVPNPYGKPFINHKNGVRDDNQSENLEWCTASENHIHAFRVLNRFHGNRKKVIQYSLAGKKIKTHESAFAAAKKVGGGNKAISNCLTGRSGTAYGYKWEYA